MLVLIRDKQNDAQVKANARFGSLYLNGAWLCNTLENKNSEIPDGVYYIEVNKSPKFKRNLPLVYNSNVGANRGIRIHAGNKPSDSTGCILVGIAGNTNYTTLKTGSSSYESVVTNSITLSETLIIATR